MTKTKKYIILLFLLFSCLFSFGVGNNVVDAQNINGIPNGPGLINPDDTCARYSSAGICVEGKTDQFRTGVMNIVNYFLSFLGLIAVLVIIYAGVNMVISAGEPEKVKKGTKAITFAVVGLLLVFLSYAIVNWIVQAPRGGEGNPPVSSSSSGGGNTSSSSSSGGNTSSSSSSGGSSAEIITPATSYSDKITALFNEMTNRLSEVDNASEQKQIIATYKKKFEEILNKMPDNTTLKRSINRFFDALDQYMKDPSSRTSKTIVDSFQSLQTTLQKIPQIKVVIKASRSKGPVPFTVQFDGSESVDPTGTILSSNYTWWYFDSSGKKIELGNGPVVTTTFTEPNSYMVHLEIEGEKRENTNSNTDEESLGGEATITVKAEVALAKLHLLVNDTNVTNRDFYKVTLQEAQEGLVFDPTQSKAKEGFSFTKIEWNFGDATFPEVTEGIPAIVKHPYKKLGKYQVRVTFFDNDNQRIEKTLNIEVASSVALITVSPEMGTTDTTFRFSSEASEVPNGIKEVHWKITSAEDKVIKELQGENVSYQFDTPGTYILTVTITDNDGQNVQETTHIKVSSKPPVARMSLQKKDQSHPNTYIFDAAGSYDADKDETLTYTWFVNGKEITLNNPNELKSKGLYTFDSTGEYQVKLKVIDSSSNITEKEEKIIIDSTLSADVTITPLVTQVNKEIVVSIKSDKAVFYMYDFGDGSKEQTDKSIIKHSYSKAGVYALKTIIFDKDNNENAITSNIYIGDADTPLSVMNVTMNGQDVRQQKGICSGNDGIIASRVDSLYFDGSNSLNRDGTGRYLTYSWSFGDGTVSTQKSIMHKFITLSKDTCFPVVLTVTDKDSGKIAQSSPFYIKVVNTKPTLQDLAVYAPANALTPVSVNITAIGAKDEDGKIILYKWYYQEEGTEQALGTHTTDKPSTTFLIPNRGYGGTSVYHFILEMTDNDNEVVQSDAILGYATSITVENPSQTPPSLHIEVDKTSIKVHQSVRLNAVARDSKGNILKDGKISWDFNNDSMFEDTSSGPSVYHIFNQAGNYTVRAKVDYQGTTNESSVTIYIDEDSATQTTAAFVFTTVDTTVFFKNNSKGNNLSYQWDFDLMKDSDGDGNTQNDVDATEENPQHTYPSYGFYQAKLTATSKDGTKDDVVQRIEIKQGQLPSGVTIDPSKTLQAILLSLPETNALDKKIHLRQDQNSVVFFSKYSTGTSKEYQIDKNIYQDSNGDGIPDNDIDNKNTSSFTQGDSITFSYQPAKDIAVRLTVIGENNTKDSMTIPIVFDDVVYNQPTNNTQNTNASPGTSEYFKDIDSSVARIKALIADAEPVTKIKINRSLLAIRSVYGTDNKSISEEIGKIGQYLDQSESLSVETKTQVRAVLQTMQNSFIPAGNENINSIENKNENINGAVITNENENLNTNVNGNPAQENVNGGVPVTPEDQGTPVWISLLWGLIKIVLWGTGIFIALVLILFIGFFIYKRFSGQDELDFEEFILDIRSIVENMIKKITGKGGEVDTLSSTTPSADTVKKEEIKTEEKKIEEETPEKTEEKKESVETATEKTEPPSQPDTAPDWLSIGAEEAPEAEKVENQEDKSVSLKSDNEEENKDTEEISSENSKKEDAFSFLDTDDEDDEDEDENKEKDEKEDGTPDWLSGAEEEESKDTEESKNTEHTPLEEDSKKEDFFSSLHTDDEEEEKKEDTHKTDTDDTPDWLSGGGEEESSPPEAEKAEEPFSFEDTKTEESEVAAETPEQKEPVVEEMTPTQKEPTIEPSQPVQQPSSVESEETPVKSQEAIVGDEKEQGKEEKKLDVSEKKETKDALEKETSEEIFSPEELQQRKEAADKNTFSPFADFPSTDESNVSETEEVESVSVDQKPENQKSQSNTDQSLAQKAESLSFKFDKMKKENGKEKVQTKDNVFPANDTDANKKPFEQDEKETNKNLKPSLSQDFPLDSSSAVKDNIESQKPVSPNFNEEGVKDESSKFKAQGSKLEKKEFPETKKVAQPLQAPSKQGQNNTKPNTSVQKEKPFFKKKNPYWKNKRGGYKGKNFDPNYRKPQAPSSKPQANLNTK